MSTENIAAVILSLIAIGLSVYNAVVTTRRTRKILERCAAVVRTSGEAQRLAREETNR